MYTEERSRNCCCHGKSVHIRLRLKRDGTRAETRFRLSPKRTSPFASAGASLQSTAGSRGVRISVSNAGYTMFRGSVQSTGYPLHSPVSPSLPFPCITVCHQFSNALYVFWVSVCSLRHPACTAHALYCHLCPARRLYSIFPRYLLNVLGKKLLNMKCFFDFLYDFVWNISHSKKNWATYYHTCTQFVM